MLHGRPFMSAAVAEPRLTSDVTTDRYKQDELGLWDGDLCCTERVSDELLAGSYLRYKAEGLLDKIFYEGTPSLTWFMTHFAESGKVEVLAVLRENEDKKLEHLGLGWLNSRTSPGGVFDKMEVGFGFFRDYHQPELTTRATRLMIEYAFRALGISAMYAVTPAPNRAALIAERRIGFEMFGPIPHWTIWDREPCSVYMLAMTKDRWERIKQGEVI
jgi:RimJ/RimL family protein N-acetyltransferase